MNVGFITLNKNSPFYMQIYHGFREAIEKNYLQAGERLLSIRSLSEQLSVSKTTVERAYDQLYSEGYIEKNNCARYTVVPISDFPWKDETMAIQHSVPKEKSILFDFSKGEMDVTGFDFDLWRRSLLRSLENEKALVRYGDFQGEFALREEIVHYLFQSRGVKTQAESIVIGANAQVLLGNLCSLLNRETDCIAFEEPGFVQGRHTFSNYAFPTVSISLCGTNSSLEALKHSNATVSYHTPSHQFPTGVIMPIRERTRLLRWAEKKNHFIIEDDYDSEFRYYGNPIPALKGLDYSDKVIYLGSFSKILPPSIRISYMVLPYQLLTKLNNKQFQLSQTSSTTEQLALADFMKEGHLNRQIRRLRKQYHEKRNTFLALLKKYFKNQITIFDNKSGLFIVVEMHNGCSVKELKEKSAKMGLRIASMQDYALTSLNDRRVLLYFSGIPLEKMSDAVALLYSAWGRGQ